MAFCFKVQYGGIFRSNSSEVPDRGNVYRFYVGRRYFIRNKNVRKAAGEVG